MCFARISEQTAIFSLYSNNLPGFHNRGRGCLLRGTKWAFKSDGYSFVPKWLNRSYDKLGTNRELDSSNPQ